MGVFFSNCVSNISIVVIVVIVVIVATIRFPLSSCRNKNLRDKMPMFTVDSSCSSKYGCASNWQLFQVVRLQWLSTFLNGSLRFAAFIG